MDNASKAAVVYQNFMPDGSKRRLLHVHKGTIDGHTCHAEAEALLSGGNAAIGWQEMKAFLSDLVANVGFPAQEMAMYDSKR